MKYTLPRSYANAGLCVEIPDATLKKYRSELGGTKAAVDKWLYENGYMEKVEYESATEKAQANKPVKREFKVDQEKADIIKDIFQWLARIDRDGYELYNNLEIVNPNRMIAFSLGDNNYELTLVRKKAKK
jgi:ribosomal protein S8